MENDRQGEWAQRRIPRHIRLEATEYDGFEDINMDDYQHILY